MAGRNVIAQEVQSMIGVGFQHAKSIVLLAEAPAETWKTIGARGRKRRMCQAEAARIRAAAEERIRLVDEDEPGNGESHGK
jgi:hypothetical protein